MSPTTESSDTTSGLTIKKPFLSSTELPDLLEFISNIGESKFRAAQIHEWIVKHHVVNPSEMTNLSAKLRSSLTEYFNCDTVKCIQEDVAPDGSGKYLLELYDGETVECATIPAEDGRVTFCISSQVGCPVGCRFCASGAAGLTRNLDAAEIIEEFFVLVRKNGKMPDNVVVMGVGEPLLNYGNLEKALDIITDPDGIALAQRRVTISTSGWVPGIRNLAAHGKQWNLALSLHAPNDIIRAKIIPDRFRRSIREILQACRQHRDATKRLLTLEYVLLAGVNDAPEHARALAELALENHAKVNLIPYNKANGNFERPDRETIRRFETILYNARVPVTVRVEKGFRANAACGQLRASHNRNKEPEQ